MRKFFVGLLFVLFAISPAFAQTPNYTNANLSGKGNCYFGLLKGKPVPTGRVYTNKDLRAMKKFNVLAECGACGRKVNPSVRVYTNADLGKK